VKAKNFRIIDKQEYLNNIEDLIESCGQCAVIDHCMGCPFNQENSVDDINCEESGYSGNTDPYEDDIIVLENAIKFRKMLLRRRRNGIIG